MFGGAIDAGKGLAIEERAFALGDDLAKSITVARSSFAPVRPDEGSISSSSVNQITFVKRAASDGSIDMAGSYFTCDVRLQPATAGDDASTTGMSDGNLLTVVPGAVHAMFDSIRVFVNSVEISDSQGSKAYPWLARARMMLESADSLDDPASGTFAWDIMLLNNVDGYEPEGNFGNAYIEAGTPASCLWDLTRAEQGAALRRRRFITKADGTASTDYVKLLIRPRIGIFGMGPFLPPGTEVRVQFTKAANRSQPCIGDGVAVAATHSGTGPYLCMRDASFVWNVRTCYLSEEAADALKEFRTANPLHFTIPMARCVENTITTQSFTIPSQLSGVTPDLVVIFASPVANQTDVTKSMFGVDDTARLTDEAAATAFLRITAGGTQYPIAGPLQTHGEAFAAYENACTYTDGGMYARKTPLSYAQWKANPIYCINLREDGESMVGRATDDLRRGGLDIVGAFKSPPTATKLVAIGMSWAQFSLVLDGSVQKIGY